MSIKAIDRQSLQAILKHPTLRLIMAMYGIIVLIGFLLGIILKI